MLLRRATSNAYYALFYALSNQAADLLAGEGRPHRIRVYRALDHARAKKECNKLGSQTALSVGIRDCAGSLVTLQEAHHKADYDPRWVPDASTVLGHIDLAQQAIDNLTATDELERRAFVLCLLFQERL